jgi:hypothetical protein
MTVTHESAVSAVCSGYTLKLIGGASVDSSQENTVEEPGVVCHQLTLVGDARVGKEGVPYGEFQTTRSGIRSSLRVRSLSDV